MEATELDKFEKKYWSEKLAELRKAEAVAQQANTHLSNAQVAFQGFATMLKEKYELADDVMIDENGEING